MQGCRSRSLTVAAVQPGCVAYDVAHNATAHAELVRAADARVVVFPELSLTGYELDAPGVRIDDRRLAPIVDACASTGALALVGAPVTDGGGEHIAMLAVDLGGAEVAYRKMWLSDVEARRFTPGAAPAVVTVDGWRLGLAICKDTGVVEHAAATADLGIDAYVAGVLDSADDAAIQEQRARRITGAYHVWMVVSSFAGSTGGGYESTSARSRVWSPTGEVVAEAGIETGGIARATLTSVSGSPS